MATRKASCNCGQLSVTYEGPDPQRVSLCQCYECQKRTGTVLSMQTRLPLEHVTIEGQSKTWLVRQRRGHVSLLPGVRFNRLLGHRHRTGVPRDGSRQLHRSHVSAADDFRLRGVRACVDDERLGPSDAGGASRLRRNLTWRATTVTSLEQRDQRWTNPVRHLRSVSLTF
jgi:hypothetical protein